MDIHTEEEVRTASVDAADDAEFQLSGDEQDAVSAALGHESTLSDGHVDPTEVPSTIRHYSVLVSSRSRRSSPSLQLTAMISNLATSYNVVNVSMVLPILQHLYPHVSTEQSKSLLATSLLGGMMAGQLIGGALGDFPYMGRLRALQLVMALQVIASLASSVSCLSEHMTITPARSLFHAIHVSVDGQVTSSLYMQLAFWRFLLGVGAGAVYPLAAVISAEHTQQQDQRTSEPRNDSTVSNSDDQTLQALSRVVLTFSMQGIGFLAVPVTALLLLYSLSSLDLVWRLLLALGSLPGLVLLVLHCMTSSPADDHGADTDGVSAPQVEETLSTNPDQEASAGMENSDALGLSEPLLPRDDSVSQRQGLLGTIQSEDKLLTKLMGTAVTWFLFDVLFYGNTLFQPIVMSAAFGKPASENGNPFRNLRQTALDSFCLTSMALPGYFVAAWILGTTSRLRQTPRYVMLQGFACMSVLYLMIGLLWEKLKHSPALLVVLYGLTFFFANYGPNTTTFVLPSLVYSPSCRATLNGVCAAAGKLGAFVGAAMFAPVADTYGNETVMMTCSLLALAAFAITYHFVRI